MPTINSSRKIARRPRAAGLSEAEAALVSLVQIVIGATVLVEPSCRRGLDRVMAHLRTSYLAAGKETAAAVVEGVRLRSTGQRASRAL
jgi:hypothetical protein